jgi:formylglycine-generating enzyme required for sulfatase activity
VALKFIRLGGQGGMVELRSLELMKDIRHPNLLALFGAWQRDDLLILAMELGDRTLLERLREATAQGLPGIPFTELLEYLREAAKGIDQLNKLGIQHRDIKPQNLLLVGGGVKVADFGLAKLLEHSLTNASGSMTPAYAAPEVVNAQASRWSDQYSLAVTYCLLRQNRLPFEGSVAQMLAGHLMQEPNLTMLPEAERPVVARALAKKPEDRWPSCQAFIEALVVCAPNAMPLFMENTEIPAAASKASATTQFPGLRRRRPAVAGVLGALGLAGLVALSWLLIWGNGAENRAPGPTPPQTETAGSPNQVKPRDADTKLPASPGPAAEFTNTVGMKLVRIPAGTFLMGSPKDERERGDDEEQHEVVLSRPFYAGVHEVTVGQFRAFVEAEGYKTGAEKNGKGAKRLNTQTGKFELKPEYSWRNPGWAQDDRDPVVDVSWHDAKAFCRWLSRKEGKSYRLPTEAEWEYACRAGTRAPFSFGRSLSSAQANFLGSRPYGDAVAGPWLRKTVKVGSYEPNEFGLYDMHGNAFEWCQDWYGADYYQRSPREDPQGPDEGGQRVVRGGSWSFTGQGCRSAFRGKDWPDVCVDDVGFRVVCATD